MDLINHLRRFRSLSQSKGYRVDNIEVIEGRTYFYNISTKGVHDVTDYEDEDIQILHSVLERYINKKVKVKNFVRDIRDDCFDDGGYTFYVGEYKGKFVLGSNYITYNNEFSNDFVNINELEPGDENIEYKFFDSLEDINAFLERLIKETVRLEKEYDGDDWGYETWEMDADDFENDFMYYCVRNLGSAFSEDPEDNTKKLLGLTSDDYTPRLTDPMEYYNRYIEDNNIEAIELN